MKFQVAAGTLIDARYSVISRVGSGGMAEVYCAEDAQLGRRVAVKLLHERFAQDEEFVERFRREASSAASLSHANIVNVYDRGEWGGTYYIAMEYLEGRSLDSIVREEAPLRPERAIEITEQVLRASRFAHRRGVVHRDLKPHNVIIDDEGRVKVTDFGIARAGASEITQTGSIMGTARYLSPEQAQGNPVSPRSDLYAIGIMLYELLTGTVPFEGDSVVAIALRHLSEPPRPPSSLVPTISPNLDAIVMRALAKSPESRFADADEFLAALEGERERLRAEGGSHTAALAPVVLTPNTAYPHHPATYTTQAIGPIGPVTGAYGTAPAYWDPNTTGIIPPGAIVLPPGRQGPPRAGLALGAARGVRRRGGDRRADLRAGPQQPSGGGVGHGAARRRPVEGRRPGKPSGSRFHADRRHRRLRACSRHRCHADPARRPTGQERLERRDPRLRPAVPRRPAARFPTCWGSAAARPRSSSTTRASRSRPPGGHRRRLRRTR